MTKNLKLKENTGITIIALIVTIIVLLILAGVNITMLTGENGLLSQAEKSKNMTKKAEVDEVVDIAMAEYYTRKKTGEDITLADFLNKKAENKDFDNVEDNGDGTYTITKNGYEVTVNEQGPVIPEIKLEVGDYVEYNVTYTDIFTNYQFTAQDGWRILDPGTKNADGTYTGVKIISTGIPANLRYSYTEMKNIETDKTTLGKWAGNEEQRKNYANDFYVSARNDTNNNNMYAAAGLYYNFELVKFTKQDNQATNNEGEYIEIRGKTEGEITGKEFIIDGLADEVHNLTLAELNKARKESNLESTNIINNNDGAKGLFNLRGLEAFKYDQTTSINYWLASPYHNNTYDLYYIYSNGYIDYYYGTLNGIRPVISLKPNTNITKIEK